MKISDDFVIKRDDKGGIVITCSSVTVEAITIEAKKVKLVTPTAQKQD